MKTSTTIFLSLLLGATLPAPWTARQALGAEPTATSHTSSSAASAGATGNQRLSSSAARPARHVYKEQDGDLPNFHQVHPYLYRGGEPTSAGLNKLKQMGVTTIIDLRGHPGQVKAEAEEARRLGLKSINLPMSAQPPTDDQVKTLLETLKTAKEDPAKGKVFVHCAHGSDRTGCMIGIWRVVNDGWTYDQAFGEMRKYYFNPKFTRLSDTVKRYTAAGAGQQLVDSR
ncbi:MAG TPA: tyrosine-protein phosphatase [Candidatus Obscuribacterales bacterium]